MKPDQKKYNPLPLIWYALPFAVFVILGIADSIYLGLSHYKNYTDIGYQSFCALSKKMNCDTVSQSPYAIFLNVPVSVWAGLSYVLYFFTLTAAWRHETKQRLWAFLCAMGMAFTLYSIYLAYISTFVIKSYCIMCIGLYVVNLSITYYAWLIFNRFSGDSFFTALKKDFVYVISPGKLKSLFILFGVISICGILWFPRYWNYTPPENNISIATGMTEDYSPWIGAKENPELVIHEYSDYLCFQCGKMHNYLRHLISRYPNKIRLVHHNYPMDHKFNPTIVDKPFHVGSGKLALISIHASLTDDFWEVNDRLFKIRQMPEMNIDELGRYLDIKPKKISRAFINKSYRTKLNFDIKKGLKNKILGTPSYIINDQVYEGTIPPAILDSIK